MNLRRLFYDFTNPKDWFITIKVKHLIHKIKDYDRLDRDYCIVICHATGSKMSYTTYDTGVVCSVIDDTQSEIYHELYKSDILGILEEGGTIEDIKNYFEIV